MTFNGTQLQSFVLLMERTNSVNMYLKINDKASLIKYKKVSKV